MLKWLEIIVGTLRSSVRSRHGLALENLALRQQLATQKHCCPRPHLSDSDRLFWVVFSRLWPAWTDVLHVVQPATVIRWHRQGFRYFWRWKSRNRGRPSIDTETRELIRRMSLANPLWGATRIHGELLMALLHHTGSHNSLFIRYRWAMPDSWSANQFYESGIDYLHLRSSS